MPLDRTGTVPGTVSVFVTKRPATGTSTGAFLYLTGGPGDSATENTLGIAKDFAAQLVSRDLYVLDYRGVGRSGALTCRSEPDWARCAEELGPRRHFYTTRDIVEDIEAIRMAAGVDRFAIYGVSYGTKIAQAYALRYGDHVERLVLDSVVPVNGWDAFFLSQHRAIGRTLSEICAAGRCRGITRDPLADVARLAAQLEKKPLPIAYLQPSGTVARTTFEVQNLFNLFSSGNVVFDNATRARWPSAIRSALQGDPFPIGRMRFISKELFASVHAAPFNHVVWHATQCEDMRSPWRGTTTYGERLKKVAAAVSAIPARSLYPLPRSILALSPNVESCIRWPEAPEQPVIAPGVRFRGPTLILAGSQDTRTPVEDARAAAKLFPHSALVVVPDMGHALYGNPRSPGCVQHAFDSFFANKPTSGCGAVQPLYAPTPVAPTALDQVAAWPGVPGLTGRSLRAAIETLDDVHYTSNSYGAKVGLRGGTFTLNVTPAHARLTLRRIVYVPGVVVGGSYDIKSGAGTLTVSRTAAHGTLKLTPTRITGSLGGVPVNVPYTALHISRT
jgi:pimeloyl-ACP methyl ester carboxylesterase